MYEVTYSTDFEEDLLKVDKSLQIIVQKKILKIISEDLIARKHLQHGVSYFVEKVTLSSRLVYNIKDNKIYIIRFFKDHDDYKRWCNQK
ncbi:MAG: hypothetical protein WCF78_00400 [archaeon]